MVQEDKGVDGYETRNDLEKGALGFVVLTRRLIVLGAEMAARETAGLQAFGTKICASPWLCDSGKYLPPSAPLFTDWGTDTFL